MNGQYDVFILILLLLIFVKLFFPKVISGFSMTPYQLDIQGTGKEPGELFKLPVEMRCTPGPSADSSYYSTTQSPGGLCGDGEFVNQQMKNYKIV